ncbi:MAG: hypothetical protein WCF67_15895 [Chitinophagaceae bacterium]
MANEQNSWEQQVKARGELTPGSKLLLPMYMDALVAGAKQKGAKWKNTALNLLNLKNSLSSYGLGKYLDEPFDRKPEDEPIYKPGVHLHWVLPKVFRHGVQKETDGAPVFPLTPNRWLIVRTALNGDKTITKSWIVESDHITKGDAADPNWLLLNNAGNEKTLTASASSYEAIQTGRTIPFDENWKESAANPLFLTIMAPGDPAFAASYASCKGVFGFHDDMMDKGVAAPNGLYAYMVTGWYSDLSKDILQGMKDVSVWIERMKELSLEIELPEDNKDKILLPDGILCHSMIFEVEWKGSTFQYNNTQLPDTEFVEACIGYSAMDALAPLVLKNIPAAKNSALESFFAAFQYKMISDFDSDSGKEVLKKQVHAKTFNTLHGGSVWVIERKETKNAGSQKTGLFPPLPADLSQKLKDLNALQAEYNEKTNELHSLQAQLYAFWFRRTWTYTEDCRLPKTTDDDKRRLNELRTKLKNLYSRDAPVKSAILLRTDELKARLMVLKDALRTSETGLRNALDAITRPPLSDLTVKETKMQPYYLAKDPSVVITGVQPSDKYKDDHALNVRFANQLINKITYVQESDPRTINVPVAQLNELTSAVFPANKNIPSETRLLFNELQLLNPSMSLAAAKLAYQLYGGPAPAPEKLKALADQISGLVKKPVREKFKTEKDSTVVLPLPFSFPSWVQPWTPLFMEWEVEWFPSYNKPSQDDVMGKWNFGNKDDGIYNNVDFVFKKEIKPGGQSKKYSGRIPLTADLGKKIQAVFKKDLSFLSSAQLETLQPLSQELSGLNNNLIMRENSTQLPPLSFSSTENKFITNPLILDIDDQYTWNPMSEETGFFPFRGGHFKITGLRIIDSFGQVVDILRGKINASQSLPVIMDGGIAYMQLPLRIAQPARLRFKWMSASEAGRETDSDPGTSPVCGWLLCNKLDKSLMVFDAAGTAVGALAAVDDRSDAGAVTWTNAPGVEGNKSIDEADLNEHAKSVVKSILATGTAAVLNALIDHIDELQKRAHAKTSRQHITMALPVGYPVAIVKASCKLELRDLPAQYQGWDWETYDASLSNVKFPVYLGDVRSKTDGLAGYFLQGDYMRFNLPYAFDKPAAHPYFIRNAGMPVAVAQNMDLVVLMDPRLALPVNCGILPSASYELPGHLIDQAIESIQLSFLVSPVITSAKQVQLPLAAMSEKEWRWITLSKEKNTLWKEVVLENAMKGVLTFEPLHITEGWLKLVNKQTGDQPT